MNRKQRRQQQQQRGPQFSDPKTPGPGEAPDTRGVYGAGCTYWGSIYSIKVGHMGSFQIPVCPHCHGLLNEMPTEQDYLDAADQHAVTTNDPGYSGFIRWVKGRPCRSLNEDDVWDILRKEYEAQPRTLQ